MPDSTLAQIIKQAARQEGWHITNSGEAILALELRRLGYNPDRVESQFSLGKYRLDFALVEERINIEADGWVHTTKDVRKRDRARDRQLRQWGWTTIRISLEDDLREQLRRRLPAPGMLADYASALQRILCEVELALSFMSRRSGREPAECMEAIRRAVQVTCQNVARSRGTQPTAPARRSQPSPGSCRSGSSAP